MPHIIPDIQYGLKEMLKTIFNLLPYTALQLSLMQNS